MDITKYNGSEISEADYVELTDETSALCEQFQGLISQKYLVEALSLATEDDKDLVVVSVFECENWHPHYEEALDALKKSKRYYVLQTLEDGKRFLVDLIIEKQEFNPA